MSLHRLVRSTGSEDRKIFFTVQRHAAGSKELAEADTGELQQRQNRSSLKGRPVIVMTFDT